MTDVRAVASDGYLVVIMVFAIIVSLAWSQHSLAKEVFPDGIAH